jgi:hypothetical protein
MSWLLTVCYVVLWPEHLAGEVIYRQVGSGEPCGLRFHTVSSVAFLNLT